MLRKIVKIDEEKCNGCGLCAQACHEGAIGMVNGKAKLLRDDYCDGLGDCLPVCPVGAISFEERQAAAYDAAAVQQNMQKSAAGAHQGGCPGSAPRTMAPAARQTAAPQAQQADMPQSQLGNWPIQLRLAPAKAPYFDGAHLLVAADCTAFGLGAFHPKLLRGKTLLIGCPKLDADDQADKLAAILQNNDIKDVTVARMEVPCCGGLVHAVQQALQRSGKMLPWQVVTISVDGNIVEND